VNEENEKEEEGERVDEERKWRKDKRSADKRHNEVENDRWE